MTGTLNCTPSDTLEASADIAGNGVLAAFLLSALLTLGAVAFGYLSESLSEGCFNEIDLAVINRIHFRQNLDALRSKLAGWKDRALFQKQPSPRRRRLSRDERQEALTRFILALSDQQLATGLAVLIGAIANQSSLTAYDFRLAFGLAWFSATTHLATLDVLQDYFIVHTTVRNWRIYGMVSILILLFYCQFITWASPYDTVPIQCLYKGKDIWAIIDYRDKDGIVTRLTLADKIFSLMTVMTTFYILTTGYATRVYWTWGRTANNVSLELSIFRLKHLFGNFSQFSQMDAMDRILLFRESKAAQQSRQRRQRIERAGTYRGIQQAFNMHQYIMDRYNEAFLSLAPPLMFMISYGFAQLVSTRWTYPFPVIVDGGMGFGQTTPICFLVIPFLAAAETYYEAKTDNTTEESQDRSTSEKTAVLPTNLTRVDTIPVTLSTDDQEVVYLSQRGDSYNEVVNSIKVYFYAEANDIEVEWKSANSSIELLATLRKKDALLYQYHVLEAFEKSLPVTMYSLIIFVFTSALFIAMGIMLSTPRGEAVIWLIGYAMVLFFYSGSPVLFIFYCLLMARAVNEKSLMRAYEWIRKDSTPTDSNSSPNPVASRTDATTSLGNTTSQPASPSIHENIAMQNFPQGTC